jgi:hypothetical protein
LELDDTKEMESALLIYKSTRSSVEPEVAEALRQLEQTSVSIEEAHVPAVVGNLAGTAINILLSPEGQALANLIQIGTPLWFVVRAAARAGRRVFVHKKAAGPLAAAAMKEELNQQGSTKDLDFSKSKVWGPMEAEPLVGFSPDSFANDGASSPAAYFVAIAMQWPCSRVRTYWYVVTDRGELACAWWTQTLRERVPEFLQPGAI